VSSLDVGLVRETYVRYRLRIRLSKELGFEPVVDKATGRITKMIVSKCIIPTLASFALILIPMTGNDDCTDMDVVELAGLSELEIANLLWEKATTVDQTTG
jgi:hypothetical protein